MNTPTPAALNGDLFPNLPRNRTKLEIWKTKYSVTTERCDMTKRWTAYADKNGWLREFDHHADTEEEACRLVAVDERWPFLECITQAEMEERK